MVGFVQSRADEETGRFGAKELTHLIFSPDFRFRGNPELDLAPGPGSFRLHQTGRHSQRLPWLHRASPSATLDKIYGNHRRELIFVKGKSRAGIYADDSRPPSLGVDEAIPAGLPLPATWETPALCLPPIPFE